MAGEESRTVLHGGRMFADAHADRKRAIGRITAIEALFASLMDCAEKSIDSTACAEAGLGGKLLYAGNLDQPGCAVVAAGNVAGAATIAASADAAQQRAAVRDGVVDFLVNSLDEALRILKNEVRKRQPVAVCVSAAPERVEREMLDRGAQPDLLAEVDGKVRGAVLRGGETHIVRPEPPDAAQAWLEWSISEAPGQWMPKLDALAMECLDAETSALRWLRNAPRFAGRDARGVRVLRCSPQSARAIVNEFAAAIQRGAVASIAWVKLRIGEECSEYLWSHPQSRDTC